MLTALLAGAVVALIGVRVRPTRPRRPGHDPAGIAEEAQPATSTVGRRRWSMPVRRGRGVDPADLAGWCDALARALRGGATLHHSLRTVAPPRSVTTAFEPAVLALERGATVSAALGLVGAGSPHLDLVLVVLRACAEHGGATAEPIDRAAAALRQRAALAGERRTQSAQARLSAVVMTVLPGAMLGVLLITSGPVRAAVASPVGLLAIAAGGALNLTGWMWMRRMIGGS